MPRGTSRYDEARLQGRLWTPRTLGSKLVVWYDFIDASTLTFASGNLVSGIKDKSGYGFDLAQATGAKQPTFSLNALNYSPGTGGPLRPGLICDGTREVYSSSSLTVAACGGYAVYQYTTGSSPSFGRILGMAPTATGADNSGVSLMLSSGANNLTCYSSGFKSAITLTGSTGQALVATSICDGTNNVMRANGTNGTTVALSPLPSSLFPRIIGNGDAADFNGVISEALIVDGNPYVGNSYEKVEGYLAWKWGLVDQLTPAHPYRNRPPTIGG